MMKRILTASLIAAVAIVAVAPTADAMRRGGRGDNAVPQQRAALKKEFARARAVGGYVDPFTFIGSLFGGEEQIARGQIQRPIVPGPTSEGRGIPIWTKSE